ncbi:MAG: DUF2868 domain-containing protein [Psychromonas sp.]|nr:DUF2868 domain-containing protein [Alteromonadales bacterium]MCP5077821.1 DUF2868 domain-containing protein [Psychromonas sp.]
MSLFESRLLAEGVRAVEGESPILSTITPKSQVSSFESLLLLRAQHDKNSAYISALFSHFNKVSKNLYTILALLLFVFGGIAVNKVLFTEQLTSVNFFWAFALFFIPNSFMFVVWLSLFIKPTLLQNSSLSRFSLGGIKLFEKKFNKESNQKQHYLTLFNCYFSLHFGRYIGRYQLSKLTHLLWLSYFTGAILMSVLMLATHQVDFVWQTSLLSADSFQSLTQILAFIPQQLGFPVPSIEQIQQSYLGATDMLDAENRRFVWSSLLISSLLVYGLLPRLSLYLLMSYLLKQQKKRFQLDLSNSYYVQLRQLLKPNKTTLGITDPDLESSHLRSQLQSNIDEERKDNHLPECFYPVAIELSSKQHAIANYHRVLMQPSSIEQMNNVCDYQQQEQLLTDLKQLKSRTIVLYVALARLPDRGLKRFIGQLTALSDRCFYLALIVENEQNRQRDSDWYLLAKEVTIPLDNIVFIDVQESTDE